jgi:transposase
MRTGVEIHLGPRDRERLEAIIASRNSPQKHVWRSRIVLLSADGIGTMEIQRRTGKAKPTIWRWQQRFMEAGVDGLLCDATRPGRKPPLSPATIERVVEMTLAGPPGETTHWSGRMMAKAAGISHRSVQRIWAAHGLKPHRIRTFKLSKDPQFAAKVRDIVGLYRGATLTTRPASWKNCSVRLGDMTGGSARDRRKRKSIARLLSSGISRSYAYSQRQALSRAIGRA